MLQGAKKQSRSWQSIRPSPSLSWPSVQLRSNASHEPISAHPGSAQSVTPSASSSTPSSQLGSAPQRPGGTVAVFAVD